MISKILALALLCWSGLAVASFDVVALGVKGGVEEGNLTSYLIRSEGQTRYLALDAGTVLPGINKALEKGSFPQVTADNSAPFTPQGAVFRNLIDAYFISHAHLDHLAGLILSSTEDVKKTIYGRAETVETLRSHYFNWKVWPNFSDAGNGQRLGIYRLNAPRLAQRFSLGKTGLDGMIYPLSHDGSPSSMILISRGKASFAYFGDTGSDSVEKSKNLDAVWRVLGGEIQAQRLKGMIIEVSYPDGKADNVLFGHLTPGWLLQELKSLEKYSGGKESLKGLDIVISHIKPSLLAGEEPQSKIVEQLEKGNDLGVKFIFMEQGDRMIF